MVGTADINPVAFLYFLILLVPVVVINALLRLGVNSRLLVAIGRMAVQLVIVGLFLQYIFELNSVWLNLLFIALMMIVASFSAVRSCKLKIRRYLAPIICALIIPNILVALFLNALLLNLTDIFSARYLIAIEGMLLGNSLSGIVISLNHFYSNIKDNNKRYLQILSFSCNRTETLRPYFKNAVVSTLNPFIASIETMGLVALPGMMTGQMLGGTVPIVAIKYQIAIVLAILAARYFSVLLALWSSSLKAFDKYDILSL